MVVAGESLEEEKNEKRAILSGIVFNCIQSRKFIVLLIHMAVFGGGCWFELAILKMRNFLKLFFSELSMPSQEQPQDLKTIANSQTRENIQFNNIFTEQTTL